MYWNDLSEIFGTHAFIEEMNFENQQFQNQVSLSFLYLFIYNYFLIKLRYGNHAINVSICFHAITMHWTLSRTVSHQHLLNNFFIALV